MIPPGRGDLDDGEVRIVPADEMQGQGRVNLGMVVKLNWDDFHLLNKFIREEIPKAMVVNQITSMDKLYIVSERGRGAARPSSDGCAPGRAPINIP